MIEKHLSFHRSRLSVYGESLKRIDELVNFSEDLLKKNKTLASELVKLLYIIVEYRDDDTHEHTMRVGRLSGRIAKEMGLNSDEVAKLQLAAPLHDVGKIGIPDGILLKPGKLTEEEYELMKTHTTIGYRILNSSSSSILKTAAKIALTHHERWDGSGYPEGLKGENIPIEGAIVAVADSFDAMVSKRTYKMAKPMDVAYNEIMNLSGKFYNPEVVDAFSKLRKFLYENYFNAKDTLKI